MADTHPSKKPRVFYGYWIVLIAFLCLFILSGVGWYAFSLFVKPLEAAMGWSRGEIMAGFTVLFLMIAVTSPFIGRIVDRYGAKRVIVSGAIIVGLGFTFLTQMNHLWHFYLGYAIVGAGLTAMGQVPASALVSNWFQRKRGLAIGIMSTAVGGGGFVMAPIVGSYLIPNYGWRPSYFALAVITWVLIIPLALLIIKMKPSDIGLYPDGAEAPAPTLNQTLPSAPVGLTLKLALATPAFWLIAVSYFCSNTSQVGAIQNQVPYLQDIGFPVATVASALGTVGLSSAVGKLTFGWLCDRIQPKYACTIGICFQIVGLLILMSVGPTTPVSLIWMYAILMGFGAGSWLPTMSMLTSYTFGLVSYGAIFGVVSMFQSAGTAIGPSMGGFMYDIMNTYHWAFIIFLVLYLIALPAVLLIRRPSAMVRAAA